MMYLKIIGNDMVYPYSILDLKQENPQVSFPSVVSSELHNEFNVFELVETTRPTFDSIYEDLNELSPIYIDNIWTQQWEVVPASPEDIAVRLKTWRSTLVVTPRQASLALLETGLLDLVEDWVASQSRAVQIEWNKAVEIRRDWPLLNDAAAALMFTEEGLDNLFLLAMTK